MSKLITREMDITTADVFYFDRATMKVDFVKMQFGDKLDAKKCEREAQIALDGYKVVEVNNIQYSKKLYGITIKQFMDVALELDPVTRKPIIGGVK